MKQLVDLENILAAAREIGENFQQELDKLRSENETLQKENSDLRDENKILREENEKIYIEMNSLRSAKEDLRAANESFSANLSQLIANLNETHEKTMAQITTLANDGLQKIVVDYVTKIRGEEVEVHEAQAVEKYSPAEAEVIVDDAVIVAVDSKKSKLAYADFYAEANVDADEGGDTIKLKSLDKPKKK